MKLENQVVSLELAKRLKEFGVKQESTFVWHECKNAPSVVYGRSNSAEISAFTIAELMGILPSRLYNDLMPDHSTHQLCLEKFPDGRYNVAYVCLSCKGNLWRTQETTNCADELSRMLIYLIENKLVTL